MAVLRIFKGNILEENFARTVGSIGESVAAGAIFTIPAFFIAGIWTEFYTLEHYLESTAIMIVGGVLGIMFVAMLRRVMVEDRELAFPESVATAEIHKAGRAGGTGAQFLFSAMGVGAVIQALGQFAIIKTKWEYFWGFARTTIGLKASGNATAQSGLVLRKDLVARAFDLSEKYEIPVMLRPTTRVCHARQNVTVGERLALERPARFEKNPGRWCATPQFLRELHPQLNEKIDRISRDPDWAPLFVPGNGSFPGTCVVASGVAAAHTWDLLEDLGVLGRVDFYQVVMPYPLHRVFVEVCRLRYAKVLVLEETYPVEELQLAGGSVQGRQTGTVPREGELTPEIIQTGAGPRRQ